VHHRLVGFELENFCAASACGSVYWVFIWSGSIRYLCLGFGYHEYVDEQNKKEIIVLFLLFIICSLDVTGSGLCRFGFDDSSGSVCSKVLAS
jgi:hypothetical protein